MNCVADDDGNQDDDESVLVANRLIDNIALNLTAGRPVLVNKLWGGI